MADRSHCLFSQCSDTQSNDDSNGSGVVKVGDRDGSVKESGDEAVTVVLVVKMVRGG